MDLDMEEKNPPQVAKQKFGGRRKLIIYFQIGVPKP
jgi:hypothetical protein